MHSGIHEVKDSDNEKFASKFVGGFSLKEEDFKIMFMVKR